MKSKQKRYLLATIVFLTISMVTVGVRMHTRTVLFQQCSEMYKKYAQRQDISVSFVKNYRVNDSILIDVTMIEANTDSAWYLLQEDFRIPEIPDEYKELVARSNIINMSPMAKDDPQKIDEDPNKNDVMVSNHNKRTICIFHTNNEMQRLAIVQNEMNEISQH